VIPLLLAHPDIDVNVKDKYKRTPFYVACANGFTSCVREMLKDSRVKVNEPAAGFTPLRQAAVSGRLDVIKWWIASSREIVLGEFQDGCHWRGKDVQQGRSVDTAGEIQGESIGNQTGGESGTWLA